VRLTCGLDGKSGVWNNAHGKRERNAAPLRWTVTDQQMDGMVMALRVGTKGAAADTGFGRKERCKEYCSG
jgi:hypothetical protein